MGNVQPHIQLDESIQAKYALLPGDPARLDRIKPFLTDVVELAYHREYRSLQGTYKGIPILALSTGIGGASTAIAVEELSRIGIKAMIRIGSCGTLQPELKVGDLLLVHGAVRDDGASKAYIDPKYPAVADAELLFHCMAAAKDTESPHLVGLARSHDSFYTGEEDALYAYWAKQGIYGSDMETAALFTIGRLRGIKTASILNNVVPYEGDTYESIGNYVDGEDAALRGEKNEILVALEAFFRYEKSR